jgi:predicted RNA-binding Zn-ribbon protein involved in translation (DUF1610 family)
MASTIHCHHCGYETELDLPAGATTTDCPFCGELLTIPRGPKSRRPAKPPQGVPGAEQLRGWLLQHPPEFEPPEGTHPKFPGMGGPAQPNGPLPAISRVAHVSLAAAEEVPSPATQPVSTSQGFKRLAILAGVVGILVWLTCVAAREGIFGVGLDDPVSFIMVSIPFFLTPFGLVHATAWVVGGFNQARADSPTR